MARLAKRPDWHPGERKRAADFEAMSATWLDEVAPGRVIDAHPNPPRPCFYLPLVFHQGLATVGTPLAYVYLPDPGYLHAHRDRTEPDVVLLTWRWPSEPTHARCLVLARTGRPASGPWENDCRSILVDRTTYERAGAFRLTLPPRADLPWYVSVFSQCELGGETWTSAGRNPSAQCAVPQPGQEALVYYAVKPGGVARPWTLTVRTEPAGATVGPLLLVAQRHTEVGPGHPATGPKAAAVCRPRGQNRWSARQNPADCAGVRRAGQPSARPDCVMITGYQCSPTKCPRDKNKMSPRISGSEWT